MKRKSRVVEVSQEINEDTSGVEDDSMFSVMTEKGEGLPYAPEDFPLPGDKWKWRVGRRVGVTGYHRDRFLYLPSRLSENTRYKNGFASKVAVTRYLKEEFPNTDVSAFFASFTWMVPAKRIHQGKGLDEKQSFCSVPNEVTVEHARSDSNSGTMGCKAQNKMCCTLDLNPGKPNVVYMPCDMCCSMPGFCRDCCCILCYKTTDSINQRYSFFKCESLVYGNICGHLAHMDCALRAYVAGSVGGSIGLDAEYFCRRCDSRTELIPHIEKMMETCKSIDSRDEVEKVLNLGVCLLQGSQKDAAKPMLSRLESALTKLKSGTPLEGIWTHEDPSGISEKENRTIEVADYIDFDVGPDVVLNESVCYDYQIQSLKLDDEITQVLQQLKKSQDLEYKIAENMFNARKNYLQNLHQQLEEESSELAQQSLSSEFDDLLNIVLSRKEQIKREMKKFKEMKEVAKGFGRTSKSLLKEHFGIDVEP
ncbi:hypothetical protein MLD38_016921 [Melastoma candidum]|uniref:Uncharacterized protein n=1 Tax=Melastoma candidum TaxID=119954 RepID=A0ACB9QP08_9MYRT|nr:hypothetical protein MLD38_016921 [Melastoma candidum]